MSSWSGGKIHFRERKFKPISQSNVLDNPTTNIVLPSKYVIPETYKQIAAVCAIALNEEPYIDEWIEYNLFLGFSHIFIYDNSDNNALKDKHSENVTIIHFPGKVKQLEAYTHFTYNYTNVYKWGAFIDCDEFIVLKKHSNIYSLLHDYDSFNGLALNWLMFGTSNKINYENEPVTKRFCYCSNKIHPHYKSILKLKAIDRFMNPHRATLKNSITVDINKQYVYEDTHNLEENNVAVIHHYYTKSEQEFKEKIQRGRADIIQKRSTEELINIHSQNNDVFNSEAWDFYSKHLEQTPS